MPSQSRVTAHRFLEHGNWNTDPSIFRNIGLWWLEKHNNAFAAHAQLVIDEARRSRSVHAHPHWHIPIHRTSVLNKSRILSEQTRGPQARRRRPRRSPPLEAAGNGPSSSRARAGRHRRPAAPSPPSTTRGRSRRGRGGGPPTHAGHALRFDGPRPEPGRGLMAHAIPRHRSTRVPRTRAPSVAGNQLPPARLPAPPAPLSQPWHCAVRRRPAARCGSHWSARRTRRRRRGRGGRASSPGAALIRADYKSLIIMNPSEGDRV